MRAASRCIALLILFCLPSIALAALFDVEPTDRSMQYLGQIFGTIGSLPLTASGNPLISQLYYLFNQIVFALGIIIIVFTTIIGTINTAQEGEALGKKMSSVWVPARAGIGVYLLLPQVSGYNWIQVTVMWLIVQGVGAANALWKQTLLSLSTQGSIVADTRSADVNNMLSGLNNIYTSVVCMQVVNNAMTSDSSISKKMNNDYIQVTALPDGSGIQFARSNPPVGEKPLCGTVTIPSVSANPLTGSTSPDDPVVSNARTTYLNALLLAEQSIEPSAAESIANPSSDTWQYANNWVSAARAIQGAALSVATNTSSTVHGINGYSQNYDQAIMDGWIHAGNYYGQMVNSGNYKNTTVSLGNTPYDSAALSNILGPSVMTPLIAKITSLSSGSGAYQVYVSNIGVITPKAATSGSISAIPVSVPSGSGDAATIMGAIFGGSYFQDVAADLGSSITTGCLSSATVNPANPTDTSYVNAQVGDPIECMALLGSKLANGAEMAFWIAMVAVLGIWLGVSIMKGCQPLGWAFDMGLNVLMPIAGVILLLVWGLGLTLAIYVPLIPLLVFTFASITWVLLVIEAMLGAPLIALTLIIPSEDEIGKAGHAIVILLGLFLRPALMILGFIFAQKMLMVAIGILNFGFKGTLDMSIVGGVGPFGLVAILMMYVGIATSLVHESFSLIYVLPDKVLRWLGAAGEGSDAGQMAKEMEGAHDAGAGVGKGIMKGGLRVAGDT